MGCSTRCPCLQQQCVRERRDITRQPAQQAALLELGTTATQGCMLPQVRTAARVMDGKTGAEELINKVLKDPALLQTLASKPKPTDTAGGEG